MQRSSWFVTPLLLCSLACDDKPQAPAAEAPATQAVEQPAAPAPTPPPAAPASRGLVLALAQFSGTTPRPARAELLTPTASGTWQVEGLTDSDSNVFHKVFALDAKDGPALVTLGGTRAIVKLWKRSGASFTASTLWTEAFGGKFDRMRDAELGDVTGDGVLDIAVGTHDQGVMAVLAGKADGTFTVEKLDKEPDTFIHEIELGDLDGDKLLEIYATPSEPNRLEAGAQSGSVVRYVPGKKEGRKVVADLGKRHAKEILVGDVDGDGRDELYVAVEALTSGSRSDVKIVEPVEIRRYDADTAPTKGVTVASFDDRYCRFLTAGDLDGDGKKELVAAAFRSGVWLMRPGAKGEPWKLENIEKESSGFEHAALITDLDEDGKSELYVAADDQGELRRYTWQDGKLVKDVILRRDNPRETWTWNIMPLPRELLAK
jgi:hypothetical protein